MDSSARFDLSGAISSLTQGRLGLRDDVAEPDWTYWERRNLNMHRIVGLWTPGGSIGVEELRVQTRAALGRHFRRAWWRGLAFGVVVEVPELALSASDIVELVDLRENTKGTWQWIVLVSRSKKEGLGVHTWMETYLSPVYRNLLGGLQASGYEVASVRREKDGLMKILTAASRRPLPNFRNEIPDRRLA
jgi:hypothetical protein